MARFGALASRRLARRASRRHSRISHTLSGIAGTLLVTKIWDDVELCACFVLGSTSNRESFSPSGFLLGEKVPKADEGAFHEDVIRSPSNALGPASVNRPYLVSAPLL